MSRCFSGCRCELPCEQSINIAGCMLCSAKRRQLSSIEALSQFAPCTLPRNTRCAYSLPLVCITAGLPFCIRPRKACGSRAETIAFIAVLISPSVGFLKPTGIDSPEASSRCIWLSAERAPMDAQLIKSAVYCGTIGSSSSEAVGSPSSVIALSVLRAVSSPPVILITPSSAGSTIKPRQPKPVRGFSKYTRMIIQKVSRYFVRRRINRFA